MGLTLVFLFITTDLLFLVINKGGLNTILALLAIGMVFGWSFFFDQTRAGLNWGHHHELQLMSFTIGLIALELGLILEFWPIAQLVKSFVLVASYWLANQAGELFASGSKKSFLTWAIVYLILIVVIMSSSVFQIV